MVLSLSRLPIFIAFGGGGTVDVYRQRRYDYLSPRARVKSDRRSFGYLSRHYRVGFSLSTVGLHLRSDHFRIYIYIYVRIERSAIDKSSNEPGFVNSVNLYTTIFPSHESIGGILDGRIKLIDR